MDTMLSSQREYTIFIVGLLIGFVVGYFVFGLVGGQGADTETPQNTGTEQNMTDTENGEEAMEGEQNTDAALSLSVDDQSSGMSVSVTEVTVSVPSWVAVRERSDNGTAGPILGAKLFPAGTASGTVSLLRRTVPDTSYYATVYTDDGDHDFEFDSDDAPLTDAGGNTILVEFQTFPSSPN